MTTGPVLPRWIYLPAAVGALFVVLPLIAVVGEGGLAAVLVTLISSPSSLTALVLSLGRRRPARCCASVLGVPMALVLARSDGACGAMVRPLILLPLVLPPVVGGIALLYAFGRLGLIGQYLDAAGIRIAFTTTAVVLAQTFVSLPFLVIALGGCGPHGRGRLRGGGRDAGRAARPPCGGGCPCRFWRPAWCRARYWRSPARWASSAPR